MSQRRKRQTKNSKQLNLTAADKRHYRQQSRIARLELQVKVLTEYTIALCRLTGHSELLTGQAELAKQGLEIVFGDVSDEGFNRPSGDLTRMMRSPDDRGPVTPGGDGPSDLSLPRRSRRESASYVAPDGLVNQSSSYTQKVTNMSTKRKRNTTLRGDM